MKKQDKELCYINEFGKFEVVEANMIKISGYEEYDFFVLKEPSIYYRQAWKVYEKSTGLALFHEPVRVYKDAILHAKSEMDERGKDRVKELIASQAQPEGFLQTLIEIEKKKPGYLESVAA